ncbi:ferritin-like domain-containing protein [Shumkonia mesophila]|uniref:ferritin-like domain-containing protein n=1 Tax=Shumkonia mesophila TaxID=2838854 RepID=UPI00293468DE|nr:ferritin family protein [Shumkonia mesophila]
MAGQRTVTFSTVPEVKTIEDLFAIATAMEHEAATRYADLAGRMERQGNGSLATLFRRLEKEESGHEDGLGAWAGRRGIVPSAPFHFSWDMPETLTEQQFAEAGGDFLATPWRILVVAAGNEERAFAFYANIAAKTSDPDVRTYAEAMAREELDHVALLRLERRRAWRREHPEPAAESPVEEIPASLGAFERRCRDAALDTVGRWRNAARAAEAAGDAVTAELFLTLIGEEAARLPGGAPAEEAAVATPHGDLRGLVQDEARRVEASYDFMMAVAEKAGDETLVARAQAEAREKLSQLARLGDRLAALGVRPSHPRL